MHILSVVLRFLIYGVFGSSVILVSSFVIKGRLDLELILTPFTYFTFLVPGILSIIFTADFESRKDNLNKNGAITGAKIAFFSFIILGLFVAIGVSDIASSTDEAFGKALAGFMVAFFFTVWVFLPLGSLAGLIVNHIDSMFYKRCSKNSIDEQLGPADNADP